MKSFGVTVILFIVKFELHLSGISMKNILMETFFIVIISYIFMEIIIETIISIKIIISESSKLRLSSTLNIIYHENCKCYFVFITKHQLCMLFADLAFL